MWRPLGRSTKQAESQASFLLETPHKPPEVADLGHLWGWARARSVPGAACLMKPSEAAATAHRRSVFSASPWDPASLKILFAFYLTLNFRCSGIQK